MEHRPFPPSPQRRALARAAGLHGGSAVAVGAVAWIAALIAMVATAHASATRLGAWIAAACRGDAALTAEPRALVEAIAAIAAPPLAAAALAAAIAHVAQTRALWLPRRRVAHAPAIIDDAGARTARAGRELASVAVALAVTVGWLWVMAPRLAALFEVDRVDALAGGAALVASLVAALAIAWVALAALDVLVRHAAHARALAMTATETREDDRLAGADPRWRARRAAVARGPAFADAIAQSAVLVLGDDVAVAIAWHPVRRPIPTRAAVGRGPRATQLLALARRQRLAVHRDPALAAVLAASDDAIPDRLWPRVADLVAAAQPTAPR